MSTSILDFKYFLLPFGKGALMKLCSICIFLVISIGGIAEELPYFNPYLETFETIEGKPTLSSDRVMFFEDSQNVKPWPIEFYKRLAQKIENGFMLEYDFLFSQSGQKIKTPIHFIFTDRLSNQGNASYVYQAFYAALYKDKHGYEAILVNPFGIKEEELHFYIAHELFHLYYRLQNREIHRWMDEGLAQFFAYQLTHFIPQFQITKYFENPDVALEEFPDSQAKYYGNSFLFYYYLYLHYFPEKGDFKRFISMSHPKELFEEDQWKTVLQEFSIAKLLNTIYVHDQKHYSLKPLYGKVVPLEALPENFKSKEYLSLYVRGSDENYEATLALKKKLKLEHWDAETVYVIQPEFGKVQIVSRLNDELSSQPYVIVFLLYKPF